MKRRLIFSADDFGLSPAVNAGILEAHGNGVLTNASLMVNGAAFEAAVEQARRTPSLAVGLHLVLLQGRATAAPESIADLVDANGMFRNHPVAGGLRYFFTPGARHSLRREIRAQLERFRATGLRLSHVDGHLNIHMHPTVFAILLDLSEEFGIRAMRLPREPLAISLAVDSSEGLRKRSESLVFQALAAYALPRLRAHGIAFTDQIFGLHHSGHMTEAHLLGLLRRLPPGVTEIYTHASYVDAEASRWRPASYESEAEVAALTSPHLRGAIDRTGIELTSYATLAHS